MIENTTPPDVLVFGGLADHWKSVIEESPAGLRVTRRLNRRDDLGNLEAVRCLVGWQFPDALFRQLPKLEWIQCLSVGVDKLVRHPDIPSSVRITNTGGLYGDAISEYVLWAILTLSRRFHTVVQNQAKRRWEQVGGSVLPGSTVGIVGIGDVGKHVARLSKAMQMQTVGFVRDEKAGMAYANVDHVASIDCLGEHIGEIDALVLCLPLTSTSVGLINRDIIRKMRNSAVLVNIARAELIDEDALVEALTDGHLGGAALDVFDREPIRKWNRLWKTRNLLVTPHTSALTSDYRTRVSDLIRRNVVRFAEERPLLNEIDRSRGY